MMIRLRLSFFVVVFSKVMVERMIIDISKWIVIILIFFIAFACSLFLIFSHFAISLRQYKQLNNISNNSTTGYSPEILYNLKNEFNWNKNTLEPPDTCKNARDYDKIEQVGAYPAIHYFGESFGATILTTFFTLVGVIVEDNIPVNIREKKKKIRHFFYFN